MIEAPTTDEIVHALDQLHGLCNASKLQFLAMLDHLDRISGWEEDGATSLENWVAYRYAMTWQAASEHVATMRALRSLPRLAAAFNAGGMSWEVLVTLCTFVAPEQDEEWADRAQRISAAEVTRFARASRRKTREEAARLHGRRYLNASWDQSGDFLRLNGLIPGAEGMMVRKTLDRIVDQLGPEPDGLFAPYEQRLADALVELAGTRIASDQDPDRATVVVYVDETELGRTDGIGHMEDGPVVSSEIVRRLACDARVEIVSRRPDGAHVPTGRLTRVVSQPLMRRLRERDVGCVICGRSAGCHAHHVKHWAHGGRTDLDNLVLLCRKCHRLVHERGFRLARDQCGNSKLIRPDWRPVMNRPSRLRPEIRERVLGQARSTSEPMLC